MRVNSLIMLLSVACILSAGCVASQGDMNSVYARQTRLEAKMDSLTKQVQSMKGSQGSGTDPALKEELYRLQQ